MRLHYGPIPESKETPPEGWRDVRDPSIFWLSVKGFIIGSIVSVLVLYLWLRAKPFAEMTRIEPIVLWLSVALFALIPVHELLHAMVFPQFGFSNRTTIGVWPSKIIAYAVYDGELSRTRLLTVMVMPLMVLTFLPLVWAMVTGQASHLLMFVSTLNALASGGDMINTFGLLRLPRRAMVRAYGVKTYWHQGK